MDQFRPEGRTPAAASVLRRALTRLVKTAVPATADFCLLHLAERQAIVCVAAVHASRTGDRLVGALRREYHIHRRDQRSTVAQVIASGRVAIRNRISVERDATASDAVANLHRRLAPRSVMVVPVLSNRHPVGAITLGYAGSMRTYTIEDVRAGCELAARIAQVLLFARYAETGLPAAARHARQGAAIRKRMAP